MSKKLKVVTPSPVFSPEQSYSWQADDTLSISGLELDVLNKTFDEILSSPIAKPVLMALEGKKAVNSILRKNVEAGIILPAEEK